jgi:hypothetical protein
MPASPPTRTTAGSLFAAARPWAANQIFELTKAIHAMTAARSPAGPARSDGT